jgi:hypothetical protein
MKEERQPPKDRRHRRAIARAAQDLHVALRPLKGSGDPAFTAMKAAADLMTRGGMDVAGAKRTVIDMVPPPNLAGVLSIINLHAQREGLDPFGGFVKNPID